MKDVEQRGVSRKPSIHVGVRLQNDDQERVALILQAGLADNVTDAIRCGLVHAARHAKRLIKRGGAK